MHFHLFLPLGLSCTWPQFQRHKFTTANHARTKPSFRRQSRNHVLVKPPATGCFKHMATFPAGWVKVISWAHAGFLIRGDLIWRMHVIDLTPRLPRASSNRCMSIASTASCYKIKQPKKIPIKNLKKDRTTGARQMREYKGTRSSQQNDIGKSRSPA